MKKKIEFKLDEKLFNDYKSYCDKKGFDMSKRLRIFIESEIPIDYNLIKIDDVIYEPYSEIEVVNILGFNFASVKLSPKVFVIKTSDVLSDNILFYHNNKKYELEGCIITKLEDNILIECKNFTIEFV